MSEIICAKCALREEHRTRVARLLDELHSTIRKSYAPAGSKRAKVMQALQELSKACSEEEEIIF